VFDQQAAEFIQDRDLEFRTEGQWAGLSLFVQFEQKFDSKLDTRSPDHRLQDKMWNMQSHQALFYWLRPPTHNNKRSFCEMLN